jgi:hypothetical protein
VKKRKKHTTAREHLISSEDYFFDCSPDCEIEGSGKALVNARGVGIAIDQSSTARKRREWDHALLEGSTQH